MFSASGSLTLYKVATAEEKLTEQRVTLASASSWNRPPPWLLLIWEPLHLCLLQHTHWANSSEIRLVLIIPSSSLEPIPELYFQQVQWMFSLAS